MHILYLERRKKMEERVSDDGNGGRGE